MESVYGNKDPFANCYWPEVTPSDSHAVLYNLPLEHNGKPPLPRRGAPKWDQTHVRLPSAPESQYPVRKSDGSSEVVNRWELIETALLGRPITTSKELELAIFSYNSKYAKSWNFQGLHAFFEDELDEAEMEMFFENILPKIIQLALQLPTLLASSIPLLKSHQNVSLSMTQQQIACLLANAFLCTFPRRNTQKRDSEYKFFPDINFNRLYYSTQRSVMEKLKCICHYFRRVTTKMPIGVVTFRRRSLTSDYVPKFDESNVELGKCTLHVRSTGTIEADGKGLLQVDFANKMIGGGVLGQGCVQEEIRFMICPELLVTRLFTECLRPNEALFIVGVEQFSLYSGYASSFEWAGNFNDETPLDGNQRRQCQIVAIDALPFQEPRHQFGGKLMLRELTKAYVGFARLQLQHRVAPGVASGNWGCGAFNGDAHLKSLLQLMICAIAERPLVYFTFGNNQLVDELEEMYEVLCSRQVTVKRLWKLLLKFGQSKQPNGDLLFNFIRQNLDSRASPANNSIAAAPAAPLLVVSKPSTISKISSSFPLKLGNLLPRDKIAEPPRRRDYSDTDEEEAPAEERKKKPRSPLTNNGREKQQKLSLADCLESYFSQDNSRNQSSSLSLLRNSVAISSQAEDQRVQQSLKPAVAATSSSTPTTTTPEVKVVEEQEKETVAVLNRQSNNDVIVQIDEDGGEYIDDTPPKDPVVDPGPGRQTKLMDFFKMKANKKILFLGWELTRMLRDVLKEGRRVMLQLALEHLKEFYLTLQEF